MENADLGAAGAAALPAGFTMLAAGCGDAEEDADPADASVDSTHSALSAFLVVADAPDRADLCDGSFALAHAGFSGLSVETGDAGEAAFAIKEAAKTTPAVSKAERLKSIFSPKAD